MRIAAMAAGAVGGYFGARAARLLPPRTLRLGIAWLNFAMTAWVFWKAYG